MGSRAPYKPYKRKPYIEPPEGDISTTSKRNPDSPSALRYRRRCLGLSQDEVSSRIEVNVRTLANWESLFSRPSPKNHMKWLEAITHAEETQSSFYKAHLQEACKAYEETDTYPK